jgi:hypothetical protein
MAGVGMGGAARSPAGGLRGMDSARDLAALGGTMTLADMDRLRSAGLRVGGGVYLMNADGSDLAHVDPKGGHGTVDWGR